MAELEFEKWEGLGNDFVLIDANCLDVSVAERIAPAVCDRHTGIGADGILLVRPDPAGMVVVNADGSRAEMCGNGLRCAVGWVRARRATGDAVLQVATGAGPLSARVMPITEHEVTVEAEVGTPSFRPADASVTWESVEPGNRPIAIPAAGGVDGFVVSVGNPHWVFVEEPGGGSPATDGPIRERDFRFARRTNVEWLTRLGPLHYRLVIWERGAGLTQACGTGATAAAAVLVATGRERAGDAIRLDMPGGALHVTIGPHGSATMRGPARRRFRGTFEPARFDVTPDHAAVT